jgi:hypothetical protein
MTERFNTDAQLPTLTAGHGLGCSCHGRRLFTAGLLGAGALATLPALAREGVEVGKESSFSKLVPAEQVEQAATQQYRQMMQQAAQQRALGPDNHPQVQRLRDIAKRIIPYSHDWNPRAHQVHLPAPLAGR